MRTREKLSAFAAKVSAKLKPNLMHGRGLMKLGKLLTAKKNKATPIKVLTEVTDPYAYDYPRLKIIYLGAIRDIPKAISKRKVVEFYATVPSDRYSLAFYVKEEK